METSDQLMREAALIRTVLADNSGGRQTADSLTPSLNLASLGIDSLKFIMVILEIEAKLGRKIFNLANVGSARTVGELLSVVLGPERSEGHHAEA